MRTLIAVISYGWDAENGNHDMIRNSWGQDCAAVGADLRFFVGRRERNFRPKPDETLIGWQQSRTCAHDWWLSVENCCVDFWQQLTKEILRWSLHKGYDYTFLCENDTFIIPRKLMATGFEKHDVSGYLIKADEPYLWPVPGNGYFMSRRAAQALLDTPPDHRAMGRYVGVALHELHPAALPEFFEECSWHYREQNIESPKIGTGYPEGSDWMQTMYLRHN